MLASVCFDVSTQQELQTSGAVGDPHLRGPHGEHFDFYGQPNGIYALFSTPQFVVNMHLTSDENSPKARFIEELGIVFRNASLRFDTYAFNPAKLQARLTKQLEPVGGVATVRPHSIELELCSGHTVHIVQRVLTLWRRKGASFFVQKQRDAGRNAQAVKFFHLDVKVAVVGCHDAYDGALGALYQCKFARGNEKFVFDNAQEESFRVKSLFATSGSFERDSPCRQSPTKSQSLSGSMGQQFAAGTRAFGSIEP